jgi:predicted transcriptional regulator
MDKIMSARIDESVAHRIGDLARRLKTSRKRVIEQAVLLLAREVDSQPDDDVFARTFGAWRRKQSAATTVTRARRAFSRSMGRRQR